MFALYSCCQKAVDIGLGDKTSLIVAPIVAALGGKVTKMSGRGLGHTGGTVDKLESIPGYNISIPEDEFKSQIHSVGMAVIGQSGNLTPADKKLYALRDVTATVDSIPLIASSIMSKKLAAGAKSIVLDVKTGSGAFMKTTEDSIRLAEEMVRIGTACGRRVSALITNMDLPLGYAVGNALEVEEAVAVLQGKGPADLREVCLALAGEMLALCNGWNAEEAMEKATAALDSGIAYRKFEEWIKAQGGDLAAFGEERMVKSHVICAPQSGFIRKMDAEKIGIAAMLLGAGRATKEDTIDFSAGIMMHKKNGDAVEQGEPIATLYTSTASFEVAEKQYLNAIEIGVKEPTLQPLVLKKIGGAI